MRLKHKIFFIAAGLLFLCIHFFSLGINAFNPNKYSFFYCYPYFHQNWNLFVPPPENNYNLYVRFTDKNNAIIQVDIFSEILVKHQNNRIKGVEPLLLALSNTIHYFETENKPGLSSGVNFNMIETFAKNYLQHTRHTQIQNLKLNLVVRASDSQKTRIFYN